MNNENKFIMQLKTSITAVKSRSFDDKTQFYLTMLGVYAKIRMDGIKSFEKMLSKYTHLANRYPEVKREIMDSIQRTGDLNFDLLITTKKNEIDLIDDFTKNLDALDQDILNHVLTKKYISEVNKSLNLTNLNIWKKELPSVLRDVREDIAYQTSKLKFEVMLSKYIHLANRYPALKQEMRAVGLSQTKLDYDQLTIQKDQELLEVDTFTSSVDKLESQLLSHKLTQQYMLLLNQNLTIANLKIWQSKLNDVLRDVREDIAYQASKLKFEVMLSKYIHLANRYPALKQEMRAIGLSQTKLDYDQLTTQKDQELLRVDIFTREVDGLDSKIKTHSIMKKYISDMSVALTIANIGVWEKEFTQAKNEIKLLTGWMVDHYRVFGNNTVIDSNTHLMWYVTSVNLQSLNDANDYIAKLNQTKYSGYDNWRLPYAAEILELVNTTVGDIENISAPDSNGIFKNGSVKKQGSNLNKSANFMSGQFWTKNESNWWSTYKSRFSDCFQFSGDPDGVISLIFVLLYLVCCFVFAITIVPFYSLFTNRVWSAKIGDVKDDFVVVSKGKAQCSVMAVREV